jgi:hypothetical protein
MSPSELTDLGLWRFVIIQMLVAPQWIRRFLPDVGKDGVKTQEYCKLTVVCLVGTSECRV